MCHALLVLTLSKFWYLVKIADGVLIGKSASTIGTTNERAPGAPVMDEPVEFEVLVVGVQDWMKFTNCVTRI